MTSWQHSVEQFQRVAVAKGFAIHKKGANNISIRSAGREHRGVDVVSLLAIVLGDRVPRLLVSPVVVVDPGDSALTGTALDFMPVTNNALPELKRRSRNSHDGKRHLKR